MSERRVVFLTGATGNMGSATLAELLAAGSDLYVKALVLPRERQHPVVKRYAGHPCVEFLFGDLQQYEDVARGVAQADVVLHIGGMVSPLADRLPELTMSVNVQGARHIVQAIRARSDADDVRLVYFGTVAQTGHRAAPIHWGRTGDPIKISQFDQYAVSKTLAEAIVAESGLKQWVSLRQTGIAHPGLLKTFDPIMFHVTLNAVMEWVTVEDAGRLCAALCAEQLPPTLWRRFFNIGGGASLRTTNHAFAARMYRAIGIDDFRDVLDPRWFATQNFHGQWYSDSDELHALVPFRRDSMDDFFTRFEASVPWWVRLGARLAKGQVRRRIERLAAGEGGPLHWLAHDDRARIDACFGSRRAWEAIPGWDRFALEEPTRNPTRLEHGYDESRAPDDWRRVDLEQAAGFRGGALLDDSVDGPCATARWRCALGHEFALSPNLALRGGHWCPTCMLAPEHYDAVAARNPFFAQVWSSQPVREGAHA